MTSDDVKLWVVSVDSEGSHLVEATAFGIGQYVALESAKLVGRPAVRYRRAGHDDVELYGPSKVLHRSPL